jgi:hypothetical protein
MSQLSDVSSFLVHPLELDSDDDGCDDDWNALDSSSLSVPVCSVDVDYVQHNLLQGSSPSSESDLVYSRLAIKGPEDEVDGTSRTDVDSCSKKFEFQLDVVNAKWNECYTFSAAFDNQNEHLERKLKVIIQFTLL